METVLYSSDVKAGQWAQVTYQTALGAVFVEGWIFVILAVTGLRMRLIRLVPKSIMLATSAGEATTEHC